MGYDGRTDSATNLEFAMLTFTFLGTGSAFAKRSFQSNLLVEAWHDSTHKRSAPDDVLLVDYGNLAPLALHRLKDRPGFAYLDRNGAINYPALRRIFITHLHADHVGGLEELATLNMHVFKSPDTGQGFRPELISSSQILHDLWKHSLCAGLGAPGGVGIGLEDYFTLFPLSLPKGEGRVRGSSASDEPTHPPHFTLLDRYDVRALPTDHIRIAAAYDWPSFGLIFTDRRTNQSVYFSGDTRFDRDRTLDIMQRCTFAFHEVQLLDDPDPVHTLLSELRTLPEEVRRKICLYHYGDNWDDPAFDFVRTEFAGFAQPHQRYALL